MTPAISNNAWGFAPGSIDLFRHQPRRARASFN
jgi:hypothetical protein